MVCRPGPRGYAAIVALASFGATLAGGAARAGVEIGFPAEGGLPFTRAELAEAVAARIAPQLGRVEVNVVDEGLVVRYGGRERLVVLGDERGRDAARRVAQGIGDLLLEAPAAELPPLAVAPELVRPAPPARPPGWTVAALPSVGLAFALDREAALAVAADVSAPLPWRRWRFALQLATGTASSHATATARPAAGLRLGWLELRAGPVGSWVRLEGGEDAFVAGGHAAALLYVPIAGELRAVVEAGGDLYANQVHVTETMMLDPFTFSTATVASTPRAVLRGGAGVAWSW